MKTTIYCTLILLLALCSCTVETLPDEELTMRREFYYGNKFRLNGFYKGLITNQNYYEYLFFYTNGVTFYIGYKNVDSLSMMNKELNLVSKKKDHWGIFVVQNDTVFIQQWKQSSTAIQYLLSNYQYKIINDSTLFYKNSYGDTTTYRFVKYSSKPDSTNTFIK